MPEIQTARDWSRLTPEERIELRIAFGHHLDQLPPSCSPDTKLQRFQTWLAERSVRFEAEDLHR